jgi:hypothetical protein
MPNDELRSGPAYGHGHRHAYDSACAFGARLQRRFASMRLRSAIKGQSQLQAV